DRVHQRLHGEVVADPLVDVGEQRGDAIRLVLGEGGGELPRDAALLGDQEDRVDHDQEDAAAEAGHRTQETEHEVLDVQFGKYRAAGRVPGRKRVEAQEIGKALGKSRQIVAVGWRFGHQL